MKRVVIVTGGGRGIGRAISERLGQSDYHVALVARSRAHLEDTCRSVTELGGAASVHVCDVTNHEQVDQTLRDVEASVGPVEALVNNAGYAYAPTPLAASDPGEWWRVLEVNLRGPYHWTRAVLPGMVARQRGRIINMNSLQASQVEGASVAYGASKAALVRFTEAVAREYGADGIVAFDCSPGLVKTEMTAGRPDLDALPPSAWTPAGEAARLVAALLGGGYDALSGSFVRVSDDLDELIAARRRRYLRVVDWSPD
jgi:3-oxoacyl-[acyl-carrier protein] reductase